LQIAVITILPLVIIFAPPAVIISVLLLIIIIFILPPAIINLLLIRFFIAPLFLPFFLSFAQAIAAQVLNIGLQRKI